MGVDVGTATGYLDLDITGFLESLRTAQSEAQGATSNIVTRIGNGFKGLGSTFTSVGSALSKSVTTPIVGIGTAVVKTSADFESSMSKVKAISGATGSDFDKLKDKAREMGSKTKFSASEAADAFQYMAMAGWDVDNMMGGISGVMNLAAASGESLASVSDIVTDAMTAFGLSASGTSKVLKDGVQVEVDNTTRFVDALAAASNSSNTNVAMLGESFKYVAPVAGALGYSVEDTAIALGLMANQGIKASQSGTALRTLLTNMSNPTESMATAMDSLGVSLSNADGSTKTLMEVMQDLRKGFGGGNIAAEDFSARMANLQKYLDDGTITQEKYEAGVENLMIAMYGAEGAEKARLAAMLAGKTGMAGLLAIVNTGEDDFNSLADSIYNAAGTSQEMADIMNDNLSGQITIMLSALQELALQFGDILLPYIKNVVAALQDLIAKLQAMSPEQKEQVAKWAAIAAAIGPVLVVLGKLITNIGNIITAFGKIPATINSVKSGFSALQGAIAGISTPVVAIVAVIATLVAAFMTLWNTNEEFRNNITAIWDGIKAKFEEFGQGIVDKLNALGFDFDNIIEVMKAAWDGFCNLLAPVFEAAFSILSSVIGGALDVITGIFDVFIGLFTGNWDQCWNGIVEIFSGVWDAVTGIFSGVMDAIKGIADTVLGWFGTSWNDVWSGISNTFISIWNGIKSFFVGVVNSIKSVASNAWNAIKTTVTTVFSAISSFFSTVWNAIYTTVSSVITNISNVVRSIFNTIRSTISSIMSTIASTVSSVWNTIYSTISSVLGTIGNTIATVFSTIVNTVNTVWNNVLFAITTVVVAIQNVIQNVFGAITSFLSGNVEESKNKLNSAWTTIKNLITTLVNTIKSTIQTVFNAIKTIIVTVMDGIKTVVTTVWNGIKTTISTVVNAIKTTISTVWNAIKTTISTVVNGIKTTVVNVWNAIKTTVTTVSNSIKSALSTAWNAIKTAITNAVNNIKSSVVNTFNNIKSSLSSTATNIRTSVSQAFEALKTAMSNAMNSAKAAVINAMTSAKNGAIGIWNGVKGTFTDIGRNIIDGIKNGITGAISGLYDTIKGGLSGLVDKAKSALGIHSPSTVFAEGVGQWIPRGIAQGIETAMPEAKKVLKAGMLDTLKAAQTVQLDTLKAADVFTTTYANKLGKELADKVAKAVDASNAKNKLTGQKAAQALVDAAKEKWDQYNLTHDTTLADEAAFWERIVGECKKGSDAYYEALKQYTNANDSLQQSVKKLQEEYNQSWANVQENLVEKINAIMDKYDSELASQTEKIKNQLGNMFSVYETSQTDMTKETVTENLKAQVDALNEWDNQMYKLANRGGVTEIFLEEVEGMGIGAIEQLKILNSMSDEELSQFLSIWQAKNDAATRIASKQLASYEKECEKQIKVLVKEANSELNELEKTYNADLEQLGVTVSDRSKAIGQNIVEGMKNGIKGQESELKSYVTSLCNRIVSNAKNALKIKSPSRVFADEVGQWLPLGIAAGFESAMGEAAKDMQDSIDDGVDSLETHDVSIGIEHDMMDSISYVADYYESVESRLAYAVASMKASLEYLILAGTAAANGVAIGYVGYNGLSNINKNSVSGKNEDDNSDSESGSRTYIFYTSKAIDEVEAARQMKRAERDMAEGFA